MNAPSLAASNLEHRDSRSGGATSSGGGSPSPRSPPHPVVSIPLRLTPVNHRPLATHTPLGSPIHRARTRSNSAGSAGPLLPGSGYSPMTVPVMSAYAAATAASHPFAPSSPAAAPSHNAHPSGSNDPSALHLPSLPPPEPTEIQRAMEAASAKERSRWKSCEDEEAGMDADGLRAVLKRERHRMAKMAADLAALRATSVQSQFEAEVLEEGRINGLMRRLDVLQQEKGRIIVELEREEEMLTNTLQRKLDQVREEKAVLEKQIEREKKAHVILQSQLSDLRNQHLSVAEALEEEDEMEEED